MNTIDQDEIGVEPLVWWGGGEVVGNWVKVSVRHFEEFYKWFAQVQDPGGFTVATAGVATTLDDAVKEASGAVMEMLEVEPMDTRDDC